MSGFSSGSSRILFLAAAAVSAGVVRPASAAVFAQYFSYAQGVVPSYLTQYNDGAAIGRPPTGITGASEGFAGVVSVFNPPFDTDQIALVGIGGELTLQLPQPISAGSGPQVGVYSNVGLQDANYGSGVATAPASIFGGGSATVSVSQDGSSWVNLGTTNFEIPENFYTNAGPYDTSAPQNPQLADFGKPFTGTLSSFDGENYAQILGTLNGSAGGSWLNLSGSGLSEINYIQFSEPANAPSGTYLAIGAVSLANQLSAPASWSPSNGTSWATAANWAGGVIPYDKQDVATFAAAATPTTITLDGNWTVGNIVFNSANSYTVAPGSGGVLVLDNGPTPATVRVTGFHTISAAVTSAGAVTIAGTGVLTLGESDTFNGPLTVQAGATLNIGAGGLIINYGSSDNEQAAVSGVVSALSAAYDTKWTGPGLSSSAAAANAHMSIGYADGNTDIGTPAGANQLLVEYTLAGDASLSGTVGIADLLVVAQRYEKTGMDWSQGNFTYDPSGSVGIADLLIVVQNFGKSLSPAIVADGLSSRVSPAPEPGMTGVLLAAGLFARRRARRR